jgi:hypothetical protein
MTPRAGIDADLLRLHGLGLLNVGPNAIAVTALGRNFHDWIRCETGHDEPAQ